MVRFRASAGKSNKTVSTSGSFTGDRWFESISLQRRVSVANLIGSFATSDSAGSRVCPTINPPCSMSQRRRQRPIPCRPGSRSPSYQGRRRRRRGDRAGYPSRRHPRPARQGAHHPHRERPHPSLETATARHCGGQRGSGRARAQLPRAGALASLPLSLWRDDRARSHKEGSVDRRHARRRRMADHAAAGVPLRHAGH